MIVINIVKLCHMRQNQDITCVSSQDIHIIQHKKIIKCQDKYCIKDKIKHYLCEENSFSPIWNKGPKSCQNGYWYQGCRRQSTN